MPKTQLENLNQDHNIVIKGRFLTKKHPDWKWMNSLSFSNYDGSVKSSYKSHLNYVGRKTECKLVIKEAKSQSLVSYAEYMNQSFKVTSQGHITKDGFLTNKELAKWAKDNPLAKHSPIWDYVISFKQDYFLKHKIFKKEDAQRILNKTFNTFILNNKMDPQSVAYLGQFHVDKAHHFHIHLRVHQTKASTYNKLNGKLKVRTRGKLNAKSFELWKDHIDLELNKERRIFQNFNFHREKLKYQIINGFDNPQVVQAISKDAQQLKILLPKGRMQYQSLRDPLIKAKVDALAIKIINSNAESKKGFNKINNLIDQKVFIATKKLDPKNDFRSIKNLQKLGQSKKLELWLHLANQSLKLIKTSNWANSSSKASKYNLQHQIIRKQINYRNNLFKKFYHKKTWKQLAILTDQAIKQELLAISNLLSQNQQAIREENINGR